ncbi:MAG: amidase [Burkholderiales bacterium]|nr:amidase [Burkholderiales bacterium]
MHATLDFITIAEAARRIAARELSPLALTEAKLARVGALDAQINAFITLTAERALAQARAAEADIAAGRYRGPLHGIPLALKDIYATAGILTSGHSKVGIDNVPAEDSAVSAKLEAAGGVLLGKLATNEFAHGGPAFDAPWPPARNPWNPEHFTGGSSTGAGAAVAAGFVPGAMGTDTGGSVRNPAACCGTVGFKPTYGLVSRYGVIPNSFTFDHCGPLAWTVEDCALMLQAIAGYDARDGASVPAVIPDYRAALKRDLHGLRAGVIRHFWEEDLTVSDEVAGAMDTALEVLRDLGAKLDDVRMRPLQDYTDVKMTIAETELFAIHQKELIERAGDFGLPFLSGTLAGCLFGAVEYVQAQRERRRMLSEMAPLYERFDVLVTVSSAPAPRFDRISSLRSWIGPNIHTVFNVTGGPAVVLCNGYSAGGLPLAMQIAGRPFDDATVLGAAHAYERATQWRSRRPALRPGTPRAAVTPPPALAGMAIEPSVRELVEQQARRHALRLNDMQMALLCEVAPYARAMADRVRRNLEKSVEPANVFRFPDAGASLHHGA